MKKILCGNGQLRSDATCSTAADMASQNVQDHHLHCAQDGLSYIRKWLGLPQSFSSVDLFGKNVLQLPLKVTYVGLQTGEGKACLELRDSSDLPVQNTKAQVRTGRTWRAEQAIDRAIGRVKHQEFVVQTQSGRTSLGGVWDCSEGLVQSHTEEEERASDLQGGGDTEGALSDQSP